MTLGAIFFATLATAALALPSDFESNTLDSLDQHLKNNQLRTQSSSIPFGQFKQLTVAEAVETSGWRSLLQTAECEISPTTGKCGPSVKGVVDILGASSTPLGQFYGRILQCGLQKSKAACQSFFFCFWRTSEGACSYDDFSVGNEDSPCVQAAPATIEFLAAIEMCPEHTTRSGCLSSRSCVWNAGDGTCARDIFKIFFGKSIRELDLSDPEALFATVQSKSDMSVIRGMILCATTRTEEDCTDSGFCRWSENCFFGKDHLAGVVAPGPAKATKDGVCAYFHSIETSDCFKYAGDESACAANKLCVFNDGVCDVDILNTLQVAERSDSVLGKKLAALFGDCESRKSKKECV